MNSIISQVSRSRSCSVRDFELDIYLFAPLVEVSSSENDFHI